MFNFEQLRSPTEMSLGYHVSWFWILSGYLLSPPTKGVLLFISCIMVYCFCGIKNRNAALVKALKKAAWFCKLPKCFGCSRSPKLFLNGMLRERVRTPTLSACPGCGFPHTGETWCTPLFFTQKKNPDRVRTSSTIPCHFFGNIFDSIYWKCYWEKKSSSAKILERLCWNDFLFWNRFYFLKKQKKSKL